MKNFILLFFLLFTTLFAFSQERKQPINYSEFLDFVEKGKNSFKNVKVNIGDINSIDSIFYEEVVGYYSGDSVLFNIPLPIENKKFKTSLILENSEVRVHFKNCTFNGFVVVNSNAFITFENCSFEGKELSIFDAYGNTKITSGILLSETEGEVKFESCFFRNRGSILINYCNLSLLSIKNSKSSKISGEKEFGISELENCLEVYNSTIKTFVLKNNIWDNEKSKVLIIDASFDYMIIINTRLGIINFSRVIVEDVLTVENSFFSDKILIDEFDFSKEKAHIPWENLKGGKIHIKNFNKKWLNANSDSLINNSYDFRRFLKLLNQYFRMYKDAGDLKSANACYIEMKDAETRRLKYLYDTEGGTEHYLNYYLNRFLKFFAEYGTSPVRSVQISGWVILIFACFYFFFYSEWDKISRKYLIGVSEKLISYFSSEQKLEDLYSEQHKDDFNTFNQFKQNLHTSKQELPFFFMLFLKPLYWFSVVKYQFNKAMYKRIEFLQGRWSDLAPVKKIFLGIFTFFGILTYALYLITLRSLNSLILSINTFTTLGFGDIPVVGISRYVAILEGFLGWFLLSIFSVSLISQILQN